MKDDFSVLLNADHYLDWLGANPGQAVRDEIERILQKQVPSTNIKWIHLIGKPEFLTAGHPLFNDPNKLTLTRAALAVSFQMQVQSDEGEYLLQGVFSWVATELNNRQNDRIYLDLDTEMSEAAMLLKGRIFLSEPNSQPLPETPAAKPKRWWDLR